MLIREEILWQMIMLHSRHKIGSNLSYSQINAFEQRQHSFLIWKNENKRIANCYSPLVKWNTVKLSKIT